MDFFKLLQSLDELLYEVMSWLIFYPITLWRALTSPWQMMDYADAELSDSEGEQYTDALSPPLFLLVSLVISHLIELGFVGESAIVKAHNGLNSLIDSDTNLIIYRILLFSTFPLFMAARLLRARRVRIDRNALKAPFFSQCYVAAPFALMLGISGTVLQLQWHWAPLPAAALIVATLIWYGVLQTRWFAAHLRISTMAGFWQASIAMLQALVVTLSIGSLFV